MFATLSAVFWGVVTFSILVVLHEGGHFLTARAFGVHVHEFMIGLPGPAIRFHGKKTDYGITAIPLGGYVRISGMEPGPEEPLLGPALAYVTRTQTATADDVAHSLGIGVEKAEDVLAILIDWNAIGAAPEGEGYVAKFPAEKADDPEALLDLARSSTYRGLSTFKRILVLSAGVVVNLLAAILVFVLVLTLYGVPQQTLTVDEAPKDGAAAAAGIVAGDTVKAIDGTTLESWEALLDDALEAQARRRGDGDGGPRRCGPDQDRHAGQERDRRRAARHRRRAGTGAHAGGRGAQELVHVDRTGLQGHRRVLQPGDVPDARSASPRAWWASRWRCPERSRTARSTTPSSWRSCRCRSAS